MIYFQLVEVDIWQAKGIIDEGVILLTVEDPSSQVGSGGATLNALLVVTEHICARQGYSVRIPTCFICCFLQCSEAGGNLQPVLNGASRFRKCSEHLFEL